MNWKVFQARIWTLKHKDHNFLWLALLLVLWCLAGCHSSKPSIEEQEACFEEYVEEYSGLYPEATVKKTAALKCYQ